MTLDDTSDLVPEQRIQLALDNPDMPDHTTSHIGGAGSAASLLALAVTSSDRVVQAVAIAGFALVTAATLAYDLRLRVARNRRISEQNVAAIYQFASTVASEVRDARG